MEEASAAAPKGAVLGMVQPPAAPPAAPPVTAEPVPPPAAFGGAGGQAVAGERAAGGRSGQRILTMAVRHVCLKCGKEFYQRRERKYCSHACYARDFRARPLSMAQVATERPTMLDIAWAAGIFEGEGSCSPMRIYNTKRQKSWIVARAEVAQKDPWLCHRLRALFGGSVKVAYDDPARDLTGRTDVDPDLMQHVFDDQFAETLRGGAR